MPRYLALFALATSVSLSLAVPATRETSMVARGHPIYDLLALEPPPYKKLRKHASFQETVDYHLKIVKEDLQQDFAEWRQDMAAELWLYKVHFWRFPSEELRLYLETAWNSPEISIEIDAALASRKDAGAAYSGEMSKFRIEAHIIWIRKRLALLQTDIRAELHKLIVDWSVVIHERCKLKYTPYPSGLGAVLLQIDTVVKWGRKGESLACEQVTPLLFYDEKLLNIYETLSKKQYFFNLQLLCHAAAKGCEFGIGDVLPDSLPSKKTPSELYT